MRTLNFAMFMLLAATAFGVPAAAQDSRTGLCTTICVALVQAVGDEVREQIPLTCDQLRASCEGEGYLQTPSARVPVEIEANLSGSTLAIAIKGSNGTFAPQGSEHISMAIDPSASQQVGQFVLHRRGVADQLDTPLTVTVVTSKLVQ